MNSFVQGRIARTQVVTIIWQNIQYLNSKKKKRPTSISLRFLLLLLELGLPLHQTGIGNLFTVVCLSHSFTEQLCKAIKIFSSKNDVFFLVEKMLFTAFQFRILILFYVLMVFHLFINSILTLICNLNVTQESLYKIKT